MLTKYVRSKWVIMVTILFILAGIALAAVPGSLYKTTNAKAADSRLLPCDYPGGPKYIAQASGITYYPCYQIDESGPCLNVRPLPRFSSPRFSSDPIICAHGYPTHWDYFAVYCQTTGDRVADIDDIWDGVLGQDGKPAGYVSDYYLNTAGYAALSDTIHNCSTFGS